MRQMKLAFNIKQPAEDKQRLLPLIEHLIMHQLLHIGGLTARDTSYDKICIRSLSKECILFNKLLTGTKDKWIDICLCVCVGVIDI